MPLPASSHAQSAPALPLYDAHCHWQDERLRRHQHEIAAALDAIPLKRAVVNGTSPADWEQVAVLASADPRVLPAFGLHPWHVNTVAAKAGTAVKHSAKEESQLAAATKETAEATPLPATAADWLQLLEQFLARFPQSAVGETGLDNWLPDADKALQREVFLAQLALAARDNRAISIHCLRAEADLLATLKAAPALPARGIHLHGFSGSWQSAKQLLDLGACFSFSEYIAEPRRAKPREIAQKIPLERLLAETDAPDMLGPPQWQLYRLQGNVPFAHAPQGLPPKHPANIAAAYACLAELRGITDDTLAAAIESNFLRYFTRSCPR